MAAVDTFEWYIAPFLKGGNERIVRRIGELRAQLLTLRSEDERQRYVDSAMEELRALSSAA